MGDFSLELCCADNPVMKLGTVILDINKIPKINKSVRHCLCSPNISIFR